MNNKKVINVVLILLVFVVSFVFSNKEFFLSIKNSNIRKEIKVVNAYNNFDAYHPKVLVFDNKFKGYKYWMAYTPLYNNDDQTENPHVVVSNNLKNWVEIKGMKNPIENRPIDGKRYIAYYSDPVLVYNDDTKELECWFRYINKEAKKVIIYQKKTKDGVHYTDKRIVMQEDSVSKIISPAIIYEDGIYKIWYVSVEASKNKILYTESSNLIDYSKPKEIKISYDDTKLLIWHIDVSKINNKYHILISAYDKNLNPTLGMNLFYSYSIHNEEYVKMEKILGPRYGTNEFDSQSIYKSSLIYDEKKYYVIYSSITKKHQHRLGIINITNIIK